MKLKLIDFLFGYCRMEATGTFCERIINIATAKGIFIRDIVRTSPDRVEFSVSLKGGRLLLSDKKVTGSLKTIRQGGLPVILAERKTRVVAILTPFLIFLLLFLSTQFIWHVNIIDATKEEEALILKELERLGVKRGALKLTIDRGNVKNQILIDNPDLMWLWVDIRGASAIVKFAHRAPAPEIFNEEDFYNVYSTHDAVITKIMPKNGIAKVSVGDTVLKGQLLIEGVMAQDSETEKHIHASGEVYGNVWEEKCVVIPHKNEIRTPTGNKFERLSINFEKFRLKLFINSSILYENYDIIENNRTFAPFGATFTKTEYHEVLVTYEENDIDSMKKSCEEEFLAELSAKGFPVVYSESFINDDGEKVTLTMRALCEEPIAKERRMNFGEDNSGTDN
ncbi:MAG: sporulation protein YqfD [Clostridia bacterium]|nr:sporulation protein YqfD [Clostridia bacterium]